MKEPKKYTVKERIIHYLKKSKITQSEFCKRVGLSSGYIGAMRKSFQPGTINKIVIEFPDLDITWLLTGEGEMLKNGIAHEPDNGTTDQGRKQQREKNDHQRKNLKLRKETYQNLIIVTDYMLKHG